jgi:hypothetical protein
MQEDYIHDGLLRLWITYFNPHFCYFEQDTLSSVGLKIITANFRLGSLPAVAGQPHTLLGCCSDLPTISARGLSSAPLRVFGYQKSIIQIPRESQKIYKPGFLKVIKPTLKAKKNMNRPINSKKISAKSPLNLNRPL